MDFQSDSDLKSDTSKHVWQETNMTCCQTQDSSLVDQVGSQPALVPRKYTLTSDDVDELQDTILDLKDSKT